MKKSLLHIEEELELNMTLEEFEAWRDRNICKRSFLFKTIFFSRINGDKSFFMKQEGETYILSHISSFMRHPKATLNFKALESEKKVVLKTEIPNAGFLYAFDIFLVVLVITITLLISWSRTLLSDEEFTILNGPFLTLMAAVVVMFSIQLYYLHFCVRKVHRLVKESLLRK